MRLSKAIKDLRTAALLSQEDFALEVKASIATINRWENGKVRPNISAMKNIRTFCLKNNLSFDEIEKAWKDGEQQL